MIWSGKRLKPAGLSRGSLNERIDNAIASCYGVAPNARRRSVRIRKDGDSLVASVHIRVILGMNISAVVRGVSAKARRAIKEATGIDVSMVHIFVDGTVDGE